MPSGHHDVQPSLSLKLGPRYHVVDEIAAGGMGVVLLALRMEEKGAVPVAIKQLHAHLADDPEVVASFVDEARIASRIVHPNVVRVHDVEMIGDRLVIVMDYVEGVPLRELVRKHGDALPVPVVRRIMVDALNGLHAAHEAKDASGQPLDVVHRDVSPHNLLVGANGVTRVTDFGIAMAAGRLGSTKTNGAVKGKLQYLSPEQVFRQPVDRRTDVFAAGVVAWEALVGRKLFDAGSEGETLAMLIRDPILPPSTHRFDVPPDLDETILRALEREPDRRFASAFEFARAIERGGPLATREEVERIVLAEVGDVLTTRRQRLAQAASSPSRNPARIEVEDADVPPKMTATTLTMSRTFFLMGRQRSVSPIVLLVVGSVCVSGGLLAGFSVRATPARPRVDPSMTVAPMTPVEAEPEGEEQSAAAATTKATPLPSAVILGASQSDVPEVAEVAPPATSAKRTPTAHPKPRRSHGGARRPAASRSQPFMPDDL